VRHGGGEASQLSNVSRGEPRDLNIPAAGDAGPRLRLCVSTSPFLVTARVLISGQSMLLDLKISVPYWLP